MKSILTPIWLLAGVLAHATLLSNPAAAQEEPRRPEPRETRELREPEDRPAGENRNRDTSPDQAPDRDRDRDREREGPERREGQDREREVIIKREITELREHGRHDEAERLERQARGPGRGPGQPEMRREGPPGPGDAGEGHRRMHHLTAAIDNLHAGGFQELAHRLEKVAARLRDRIHDRGPGGPGEGPGPGPGPGPGQGPRHGVEIRREERRVITGPGREGGPMAELRELHANMEEMRRNMETMRKAMTELQEELKRRPEGR